jgi:hypothetical protein
MNFPRLPSHYQEVALNNSAGKYPAYPFPAVALPQLNDSNGGCSGVRACSDDRENTGYLDFHHTHSGGPVAKMN